MKRLSAAALLAGALVSTLFAAPSGATPLGVCDGKVDVACTRWRCVPDDNPCTASPVCLVWLNGRCAV